MQSSIDRYLRESNYEYSILNSRLFKESRDVLEGKARLLREKGLGEKPSKTNSLTRQEEDILWDYGQLGDKTPKSIIATLWWQLTQHFGLRGRQEHHSMKVEDFSFRKNETVFHSARKTLVKKLKQKQVPKSEIISITGHNREVGKCL